MEDPVDEVQEFEYILEEEENADEDRGEGGDQKRINEYGKKLVFFC